MSNKINDIYVETKQRELLKAIESGDRQKELKIREELKDSGLLSGDELESLEEII